MEGSAGRVVPTGEQVLAYWFVFQTKGCVEILCRCNSGGVDFAVRMMFF